MNYFLAPRSGEKSYKNYESTIRHGVPLSQISQFLTPNEIDILSGEEIIYAWGNRKGTKSAWDQMNIGDLVIFYAKGKFVLTGEVYFKKHSPELALAMWPPDDMGNPWEYTFFIRNLNYISVPIQVFNSAVGYKSNNIVQGFTHLSPDRIALLKEKYGSVEKLLGLFTDEESKEIPQETEKVYVNLSRSISPLFIHDAPIHPRELGEYYIKSKNKPVKIDYLARNKSNTILGSKGEEIVFKSEYKRLKDLGKEDLAKKIIRISLNDDGPGYDILSYEADGSERYIEVKTTSGANKVMRFHVSINEYLTGKSKENYYIYYVEKADSDSPVITAIKNPIDESKFLIRPDGYIFEADR